MKKILTKLKFNPLFLLFTKKKTVRKRSDIEVKKKTGEPKKALPPKPEPPKKLLKYEPMPHSKFLEMAWSVSRQVCEHDAPDSLPMSQQIEFQCALLEYEMALMDYKVRREAESHRTLMKARDLVSDWLRLIKLSHK